MHREDLQAFDGFRPSTAAWDGPGLGAKVEMRELAGLADR
jgi:hypothetical protein